MKDTMILKDGTIIDLEAGASINTIQVVSADTAAMAATWEKLTEGNLSVVQIKNGDSLVCGNCTDLLLISETSTVAADGSILTTYHLRKKTAEERRLDALEEGQQVQDGAIEDLAAVTSAIAEGGVQ